LANLDRGLDYLSPRLVARYHAYFSFTGGPILDVLERRYGAAIARPLYCSVDPRLCYPEDKEKNWDLGYMGTYCADRQPALDTLLLEPARLNLSGKFIVAGTQYPRSIHWPKNVKRRTHLAPAKHRNFYNRQRFTLNLTRADMVKAGYSPSVRLFEAAACGTPIISDYWEGLEKFFEPGKEILIARSTEEIVHYLKEMSDTEREQIGRRARKRVLANHTARHRALDLESYVGELLGCASTETPSPRNSSSLGSRVMGHV
jgi:spore maturation protein CgeB